MPDRQAFGEAVAALLAQVEKRRRRYVQFFYINSVLAFVLVTVTILYSGSMLAAIAQAMGRTSPISTPEIVSLYFFAALCAASLVLLPVFRYQGSLKPEFALHRRVWQRVCEALEQIELMPRGAEFEHQMRATGLFGEFCGVAERPGIKGRAGDLMFWVQEMVLAEDTDAAPFCGLVVFGRSDNRLHGDDERRNYTANLMNYDMALQGEAAPFQALMQLVASAQLPVQKLYWDHRLLQGLQALRDKAEDWFTSRHAKPALDAELAFEAQFPVAPDMLEAFAGPAQGEGEPSFKLSLQGNNYVAALRCSSPLFLNFSLFEAAFPKENALFIYDLVQCIGRTAAR